VLSDVQTVGKPELNPTRPDAIEYRLAPKFAPDIENDVEPESGRK
jgi:hypothetical protein